MNASQATLNIPSRRSQALQRLEQRQKAARLRSELVIHPEFEHGHGVLCEQGWPSLPTESTLFVRVSSDPLARATLVTAARFKDGFLHLVQRLIEGPLLESGEAADDIIDLAIGGDTPERLVFSSDLNTYSTHCAHVLNTLAESLGICFVHLDRAFDFVEVEGLLGVNRDGLLAEPASAHLTLYCYGRSEGPAGTDRDARLDAAFEASRVDILTLVATSDRGQFF